MKTGLQCLSSCYCSLITWPSSSSPSARWSHSPLHPLLLIMLTDHTAPSVLISCSHMTPGILTSCSCSLNMQPPVSSLTAHLSHTPRHPLHLLPLTDHMALNVLPSCSMIMQPPESSPPAPVHSASVQPMPQWTKCPSTQCVTFAHRASVLKVPQITHTASVLPVPQLLTVAQSQCLSSHSAPVTHIDPKLLTMPQVSEPPVTSN